MTNNTDSKSGHDWTMVVENQYFCSNCECYRYNVDPPAPDELLVIRAMSVPLTCEEVVAWRIQSQ